MNSPWLPDIVIATAFLAIFGYVVVTKSLRAIKRAWITFQLFTGDVRKASISLHGLVLLLQRIEQEMIYMRSMTQQLSPNLDTQQQTQPPIGQAVRMPPPFPTPTWAQPPAPDAELDDTDRGLLEQTEEQLREAQVREELTARGIDLTAYDEGELPAVREEA